MEGLNQIFNIEQLWFESRVATPGLGGPFSLHPVNTARVQSVQYPKLIDTAIFDQAILLYDILNAWHFLI